MSPKNSFLLQDSSVKHGEAKRPIQHSKFFPNVCAHLPDQNRNPGAEALAAFSDAQIAFDLFIYKYQIRMAWRDLTEKNTRDPGFSGTAGEKQGSGGD